MLKNNSFLFNIPFRQKVFLKILFIFTITIFIILCSIISYKGMWKTLSYYPKNEYMALENEAKHIIRTQNFNSNYSLIITNYNSNYNFLSMELSDNETASIKVTVNNLGNDNQEVIIKRIKENKYEILLSNLFLIFLFSIFLAILVIIFISLIGFIICIIEIQKFK